MRKTFGVVTALLEPVQPNHEQILIELLASAKTSLGKRLDLLYFLAKHPWLYLEPDQVACALELLGSLRGVEEHQDLLLGLVEARLMSFVRDGARIGVFSMPKSGSTYLSELLIKVLGVARANLDTAAESNTAAGCNAREDELDELALIQATLSFGSFVSQHHTRASASLMYSLRNYRIVPIVMIRNIPDCLVSMDDMMMDWNRSDSLSEGRGKIFFNTGGRLPYHFVQLDQSSRYQILLEAWGRWYLEFYISWKRARLSGFCNPMIIRYEEHVVHPDALFDLLSDALGLENSHQERLRDSLQQRVRFNQGVIGRGERLSPDQREYLLGLALGYGDELTAVEVAYLIGHGG